MRVVYHITKILIHVHLLHPVEVVAVQPAGIVIEPERSRIARQFQCIECRNQTVPIGRDFHVVLGKNLFVVKSDQRVSLHGQIIDFLRLVVRAVSVFAKRRFPYLIFVVRIFGIEVGRKIDQLSRAVILRHRICLNNIPRLLIGVLQKPVHGSDIPLRVLRRTHVDTHVHALAFHHFRIRISHVFQSRFAIGVDGKKNIDRTAFDGSAALLRRRGRIFSLIARRR